MTDRTQKAAILAYVASNSQNQANRRRLPTNTSGYKGVTFSRAAGKWQASIKVCRKNIYLGQFKTPVEAAAAYDKAAIEFFGEYAATNEKLRAA